MQAATLERSAERGATWESAAAPSSLIGGGLSAARVDGIDARVEAGLSDLPRGRPEPTAGPGRPRNRLFPGSRLGQDWSVSSSLVLAGVFLSALAASASEPSAPAVDVQKIVRICEDGFPDLGMWRYRPGDDLRYAGEEFDDSGWLSARPYFLVGRSPPGWEGIGWFRRRVRVDERFRDRTLGVFVAQVGAFELYIDGRWVAGKGFPLPERPGELPFGSEGPLTTLELDEEEVVLAMRVATPADSKRYSPMPFAGALVDLCPPEVGVRRVHELFGWVRVVYGAFIGFSFTLGILHLLLHAAMPAADRRARRSRAEERASSAHERAGHLDYAVFTLALGSLSLFVLIRSYPGTFVEGWWTNLGFKISLLFLSAFGARFFAGAAFGPKSPIRRATLYLLGVALLLAPWMSIQMGYVLAITSMAVMLWLVLELARRRRPDRHVIVVGTVAMLVASAIQVAPELFGLGTFKNFAFMYGFVVLLGAMAIHLTRSVGRTHRALAARIEEVERLSEANLEEQARAQKAALERLALEAENQKQAQALEEANRRAALLEELEEANRKLRATQAQLVQSEKMASLGQLVAGVAHEMNTPIGAIHSVHGSLSRATLKLRDRLVELAPGALEDRKVLASLKVLDDGAGVIATGSERVSAIVHRLRTFARLDEAELQLVDLHDGLEDTLVLTRHELKRGIEVVRDYGELPRIACYPGQLNQVFLNLVVNARQAMGEKGTLKLSTRDVGDGVEVHISDDGPGIRSEHLSRIFDPGFTTKGVGVGTGLGLAICYRIVEAHRGRISVVSAPGEGATFSIWLPKDLEERARRAERPT